MENKIVVKAFWDKEALVWVAESEDVPGLITEAPDMETLISKLKVLIPELLEANGKIFENEDIPFLLKSEFSDYIQLHG